MVCGEESIDITECTVLGQPNKVYTLTKNITGGRNDNCINITALNVTLDCQGNYINIDEDFAGVYSDQLNTTIMNCNISMGEGGYGIEFVGANNSQIYNNILNEQRVGLGLIRVNNTLIENNTLNSNLTL